MGIQVLHGDMWLGCIEFSHTQDPTIFSEWLFDYNLPCIDVVNWNERMPKCFC